MNTDNGLVLAELDPHEKRIRTGETDSIEARWEFGQILLKERVGKQLPRGIRSDVAAKFDLEASEITRRMQLAEKFATRAEVVDACTRRGASWRRIIREELPKTPRREKVEPDTWIEFLRPTLARWLREANGDDERRRELKVLVAETARALGLDVAEVPA